MKKTILSNILFVALLGSIYTLTGCSSDDKDPFIEGNTTELKKDIAAGYDSIAEATLDKYKQASIDEFKAKLDLVSGVLEKGVVSEQEVINMAVHVDKAMTMFLNSKMVGIPEEFLLAGWGFDEGEGTSLIGQGERKLTAILKSGPNEIFKGTQGSPKFIDEGINGRAIYLNNGAHLAIEEYNPSDFLGKQLTIAVWLKPEVTKGGNYVASLNYWENWKFQIQEQGKAFFTVKTPAGHTDADNEKDMSVPIKSWTHVVIVLNLDASTLSFYVNGLLTKEWTSKEKPNLVGAQFAAYQSPLGGNLPLMIGTATTYAQAKAAWDWSGWDTPSSWDYFQGAMDEIKFYNTAITNGQVQWLYNNEAANLQ